MNPYCVMFPTKSPPCFSNPQICSLQSQLFCPAAAILSMTPLVQWSIIGWSGRSPDTSFSAADAARRVPAPKKFQNRSQNAMLVAIVAFLEFRPVGNVRKNFGGSAIITVRRTQTWNRGECLRVVGIHSDGWIDRDIYLVFSPFQIITVFPTRPTPRSPHFGDTRMRRWPPGRSRTLPTERNSWHTTAMISCKSSARVVCVTWPSLCWFSAWLSICCCVDWRPAKCFDLERKVCSKVSSFYLSLVSEMTQETIPILSWNMVNETQA